MDNPFRGRGASVPILIESNRIAIPGSESTRIEIFRNRNRKDRNRIGFRFLLSYQSISHQLSFFVVVEIQVNVGRSRKMFPTGPSIRWTSTRHAPRPRIPGSVLLGLGHSRPRISGSGIFSRRSH